MSMQAARKAVILFMRYPELGRVKSRLAAALGSREALHVYEKLARRTLGMFSDFKRSRPEADVFVFFTPPEKEASLRRRYAGPWKFVPQEGSHLGERMRKAFHSVWLLGYTHVVMTGSDIPDLECSDIDEAFVALDKGKAALGPASDGGFYLIGLSRPCDRVFQPQTWGTGDVFRRTCELLSSAGYGVHRLKERMDIDRPEDLVHLGGNPFFRSRLSIVVPTLSQPDGIRQWLDILKDGLWPGDNIVVVHGSCDPVERIEAIDDSVCWMVMPRGRGVQLDKGARETTGELLWFLHDDSVPPPHFAYHIRKIADAPLVGLGCFRLAFSTSTPFLDAIAAWANLRTRWLKLPYGDQGIFCRRDVFEKAGGFKKRFLMEDVDFVREARKLGRLMLIDETIYTSAGRYLERGVLKASFQNHYSMLLYCLGVDDKEIYSRYYGKH
jgi:rSAM/selenodomain-associated transferase 2/rSAM/selenodomain-associated transferase 1